MPPATDGGIAGLPWDAVDIVQAAGKPAHQYVGDGGSAPGCSWVLASTQVSGTVPDVRQRHGCVVHHQGRQDQIVQTDLPNDSAPQVLQPEGQQGHASSPSRFMQHPGRCSLESMWARPFRHNGKLLHPVFSSWGTLVIDLFVTTYHSNATGCTEHSQFT